VAWPDMCRCGDVHIALCSQFLAEQHARIKSFFVGESETPDVIGKYKVTKLISDVGDILKRAG
jgi:hypothetical protein